MRLLSRPIRLLSIAAVIVAWSPVHLLRAEKPSREPERFFESKVRPALIEHCVECHSAETESSGGLLLDSKGGWSKGGDLGPAIVPGNPDASLLMKAIEYGDPNLEMPPDGRLAPKTIATFRQWIRSGAYDPRESSAPTIPKKQSGLSVDQAHQHWAYRPIPPRTSESVDGKEASSAQIDQFIRRRINEAGMQFAPLADREKLLRRAVFDLHGLPPTPDQIHSFLSDSSPQAYERLIDRLLASPRYAEHFARRWLDVVRYAESITLRGFILPQAWRYRDYVIHAYSQDRPFDQMIRDQLAGDLMPSRDLVETQQRAIATGFLAMGNSNLEDQDKTKLEFDHIDEQLETIGRAFLAQTIGCARCHDHKFDPIPTRDYYALAGIFRSTTPLKHANLSQWIEEPLPLDPTREAHYEALAAELSEVASELDSLKSLANKSSKRAKMIVPVDKLEGIVVDDDQATFVGRWAESDFVKPFVGDGYRHDETSGQGSKSATFDPVELESGNYEVRMSYTAHGNRATNVQVKVFSANESKTVVVNERNPPSQDGLWVSLGVYPFEKQGQSFVIVSNEGADGCVVVDAIQFLPVDDRGRVASATAKKKPEPDEEPKDDPNEARRRQLLKRQKALQNELNARPKYLTVLESEPREEIAIRVRGNIRQKGESVSRGFLSAIGRAEEYARHVDSNGSGRRQLADWIADRDNPLTARVYVNRVWSWLMGDGLVTTENNFGTTGATPSHPELLDFLADEFIRCGWSTKHLVRSIVSTETYRRAVARDQESNSVDPENRLLASSRIKRLPVESIRDAMLTVSGELDRSPGGSSIRPGTKSDYDYRHDSRRRSVYWPVFRNSLPPLFENFDFADSSVSVGQRSRSTVAPQSLALMNHPWVIERSKKSAERFLREYPGEPTEVLLNKVYLACLSRRPDEAELKITKDFLLHPGDTSFEERLADLIQSLFASIDFRYLE